jgi:hypothetical protein
MTDEQITKAIEWWMNALRKPTFSTLSPAERRDPREIGGALAEMLAITTHQDVPEEKIAAFGKALEKGVRKELENTQREVFLDVDYHPCALLADALDKAGIQNRVDVLPWKTRMWIGPLHVRVSCGYGAAPVQIASGVAGPGSGMG